jgi:hypothetical protein
MHGAATESLQKSSEGLGNGPFVKMFDCPLRLPVEVPKREIFDGGFFASKEPIWSPDS